MATPRGAKESNLAATLSSLDLPASTVEQLETLCKESREVPRHKRTRRSKATQVEAMRAIASSASQMRSILTSLPNGEYLALDCELQWQSGGGGVVMASQVLDNLIAAATRRAAAIAPPGSTLKGRPESLGFSTSVVAVIAVTLRGLIRPSVSGKFRLVCDACFVESGIPATSEAAIKAFLGWHDFKARHLSP